MSDTLTETSQAVPQRDADQPAPQRDAGQGLPQRDAGQADAQRDADQRLPQRDAGRAEPQPASREFGTQSGSEHKDPVDALRQPRGALDLIYRRLGLKYFAGLLCRRDSIVQEVERIPARMQKVTNQARLLLEMLDEFRTGSYRALSWRSVTLAAGALLYAVSPADVIPDAIPGLGSLDDLLVIGLALRLIRRDLEAYCQLKGYDPAAYF